MAEHKFKEGDRVIYVSDRHSEQKNNPLWKGKYGKVVGTIVTTAFTGSAVPIKVKWDNGTDNRYAAEDLKLYRWSPVCWLKSLSSRVWSGFKPYRKWVGLLALAVALDYFVLGCKFTPRLKALAEGVVNKTVKGLDRAIHKLTDFPGE